MLIQFIVKNFRSFRDEQALSLVASKDKSLQETNLCESGIKQAPHLLNSSIIFGANASGKSNLLSALQLMRDLVIHSSTSHGADNLFQCHQFKLDKVSANELTDFEINVVIGGIRYQYGFKMSDDRIIEESLFVFKAFKPQKWFSRVFNVETGTETYEYGQGFKGPKKIWEGATNPRSLFLSKAIYYGCEALQPFFNWFQNDLLIINERMPLSPHATIKFLNDDNQYDALCRYLNSCDLPVQQIELKTKNTFGRNEPETVLFHHKTENGQACFDFFDVPKSTRTLFCLYGKIKHTLDSGGLLIIDDLDAHLHTLLMRKLIELFHNKEINQKGAQLIFTSVDSSLLDANNLFRRDQIWFVEISKEQASSLFSLCEYKPRKDEHLEKSYLLGRYGGLPFLGSSLIT